MLGVKGDATAALYDVLKLRGKGPGMALVGRELCLTAAQHMVLWSSVEHLSGSANWLADALSRPEKDENLVQAKKLLESRGAVNVETGTRDFVSFWRTRAPPPIDVPPLL